MYTNSTVKSLGKTIKYLASPWQYLDRELFVVYRGCNRWNVMKSW